MEIELKNYRRMSLNEAGEDDAEDADEAAKDQPTDSEEDKENKEIDADAEKAVEEADIPFSGLDLRYARCFGYSQPKQDNWLYIAHQADDMGWQQVDSKAIEKNLTKDVEKSYMSIAQYKLVNIDDDMAYELSFDNNKELWQVEILNSPKAEMTTEERANFFKSKIFKKISKKTYSRLLDAKETFDKIVKPHMDNGELLLVDTVKLEAIMHFINLDHFMDNILNGKYLSYN